MSTSNAQLQITAANLLDRLDLERIDISVRLASDPVHRHDLGQFLTPASVARFMAGMLQVPSPVTVLRILDARVPRGSRSHSYSKSVREIGGSISHPGAFNAWSEA